MVMIQLTYLYELIPAIGASLSASQSQLASNVIRFFDNYPNLTGDMLLSCIVENSLELV